MLRCYPYSSDARLASVACPDATNVFTYFNNGLPKTAANGLGAIRNSYDGANRLTNSIGVGAEAEVRYTYHPAGQVSNVLSIAGTNVYGYDAAERLMTLSGPDGDFGFAYNAYNGLAASLTNAESGLNAVYEYDVMDRVAGITWKDGSGSVLRSFGYEYDDAGMITNITFADGSRRAYAYDFLDRLTEEARIAAGGSSRTDAYAYDEVGNRTQKAVDGATVTYTLPYGSSGNRMAGWTAALSDPEDVPYVEVRGYSTEVIGTNAYLGQLYVSNLVAQTPETETTNFWTLDLPVGSGEQAGGTGSRLDNR